MQSEEEKQFIPPTKPVPQVGPVPEKTEEKNVLAEKEKTAVLIGAIKDAFNEVVNYTKNAPDKERANIYYKKLNGLVFELTGRNLDRTVRNRAKIEAEAENKKIITKKEYFDYKKIAAAEKNMQVERWAAGVRSSWERVSDKEKQKIENGAKKYAAYLEEKRKKLEKKSIYISRDVYYELLNEYRPQDIKIKGIFKKNIVLFHARSGSVAIIRLDDFNKWAEQIQKNFTAVVKNDAAEELGKYFSGIHLKWMERKLRKAREILAGIIQEQELKNSQPSQPIKTEVSFGTPEKPIKNNNISKETNRPAIKNNKKPEQRRHKKRR
jgi:hypothetical protein